MEEFEKWPRSLDVRLLKQRIFNTGTVAPLAGFGLGHLKIEHDFETLLCDKGLIGARVLAHSFLAFYAFHNPIIRRDIPSDMIFTSG